MLITNIKEVLETDFGAFTESQPLGFVHCNFSQTSGLSTQEERGSAHLQLHKEPSIMIYLFRVPYAICDFLFLSP